MATQTRDRAASQVDQTIARIREINDHIVDSARRGGETSLQAYERLLRRIADAQQAAGERSADWVRDAPPAAARSAIESAEGLADSAAQQARRLPGVAPAEGQVYELHLRV